MYFGAVGYGIGSQCELSQNVNLLAPCDDRTYEIIHTGFYISVSVVCITSILLIKTVITLLQGRKCRNT